MASENEKHSKIPIFSGNREDFEDWIFDVNLWMGTTGRKKEEQAPALLLAQSVAEVKKVMRLVGAEDLKTEGGMSKLLGLMRTKYGEDLKDIAFAKFAAFDGMQRETGELFETFTRRFTVAYDQAHSFDENIKLPERVISLMMLGRSGLSTNERSIVLAKVGDEPTIATMSRALVGMFDVVTEKKVGEKKTDIKPGDKLVGTVVLEEFAQKAESQMTCNRCGSRGHFAASCKAPWEQCQKYQMKKREARSYVSDVDDESANVAFAGFAERESAPALHL